MSFWSLGGVFESSGTFSQVSTPQWASLPPLLLRTRLLPPTPLHRQFLLRTSKVEEPTEMFLELYGSSKFLNTTPVHSKRGLDVIFHATVSLPNNVLQELLCGSPYTTLALEPRPSYLPKAAGRKGRNPKSCATFIIEREWGRRCGLESSTPSSFLCLSSNYQRGEEKGYSEYRLMDASSKMSKN